MHARVGATRGVGAHRATREAFQDSLELGLHGAAGGLALPPQKVGAVEVEQREIVETSMKALGVPTAVHYPLALHMQPVFKHLGYSEGSFPLSESAARRVISLPMHPYLTDAQQVQVVDALAEAVA